MKRGVMQSVLVVFSIFSMLSSAVYAASDLQGKRFKAWTGHCEPGRQGKEICYLEQVKRQKGDDILRAIIGYAPGKPNPTVFFELPLGIDIAAGVRLKVDKQKPIRFRGRCTELFCSAGFSLNVAMMKQFLKGRTAVVSFSPAPGKPLVNLPVSLMGVTAGLKALPR